MYKNFIYSILLFSCSTFFWAQEKKTSVIKKTLTTHKINSNISIDGILNESDWETAEIAKDFIMLSPDNGKPEHEEQKTEVKVLYDDQFLYIGAKLFDNEPDKILKEITERDNFGAADFFGVFINGFNDGQHEYSFFVTASDGQADCIRTVDGEDFSWDAIWMSKTKITDEGWVVEIKIPYAALRFSKSDIQKWGIQFFREVRRLRQQFSWNHVDNSKGTFTQQAGILEGIKNIKTPTRLFFIPYTSYYLNQSPNSKPHGTLKGGLDIKFGLTDAFTLDAVLVPDFGQTKFDNQVLNLGPFEQQFNENRPFFTEGTDLFSKGNLFYSRRIGGHASHRPELENDEEIISDPENIQLLNALKISGRTKNGLGIGFLNAITEKQEVTIQKTIEDPDPAKNIITHRNETIEPLTNYNVFVLDKRFNQNSSISFINTNVLRDGIFRDANAYAFVFDLNNKKNTFNLSGASKTSIVNNYGEEEDKKGTANQINFSKTSGKIRFNIGAGVVSKDYNINDLGINFYTNYYEVFGNVNYRFLKSTEKLNSFRINFNTYQQFNKQTNKLQEQNFNVNAHFVNKKNHAAGIGINVNPFNRYNYYDTRIDGRYVIYPKNYNMWTYLSTNYNNKFAIDTNPFIGFADSKGWWFYSFDLAPRYRFNDKLFLTFRTQINQEFNDLGWVDIVNDDIIFTKRDRQTFSNTLEGKYSINSKMNFGLNVRYYWSYAQNKDYYLLLENGKTSPYDYLDDANSNFKTWNFDLSYSWWFAPGSQLSVLYRNNAADFSSDIDKNFKTNFTTLTNNDKINHTFSISLRYFLDYNQVKHWL